MLLGPKVMAQDEPAPGVARISVVQRDVSTMRSDSKDWVAATANAPVVHGDTIATGSGSRTELQLDYANVLRLDQGAESKVAELIPTRIQIQIASGLVDLAVFKGTEADVEIDTPNVAIHPLGEGVYRVQVNSAENTQLTVRRGQAEVTTPQGRANVDKGQVIYVKGTDNPEYQMAQADGKDDWDRWNDDRDHTIAGAQAWQYTNIYYTGSEDLDRYGTGFRYRATTGAGRPMLTPAGYLTVTAAGCRIPTTDGCGWVTSPGAGRRTTTAAGSRMAATGAGGQEWDSMARARSGGRALLPSSVLAAAREAPDWALDSTRLAGARWARVTALTPGGDAAEASTVQTSANINAVPATRLNDPAGQTYGSNLQGIMTNAHVRGAITTVSAQNFANGRIAHNLQPVNENMLQQASLMQGTLPVTPTKASLQPVNRPVNRAALPASAANNQHFITRSAGPASRASLPAGQMNPLANGQRVGGNVPARAGSMAPAMRPGMVGTRQNTAIGAQAARPLAGQPGTAAAWPQFGRGNQITRSTESMNRPDAGGPQKAAPPPQNVPPRQLTPAPQGNQGGWQRFGLHPAPANRGAGGAATQGQGGWNRFEPRPSGGGSSPAPRGGGSA